MASKAVSSGAADCVLALGFDRMYPGPLKGFFNDRANPVGDWITHNHELSGNSEKSPWAVKVFADAGREHMQKYGTKLEHFAKVAWKNHKHSQNNKNSQHRKEFTVEEIMKAPMIYEPETLLTCCPNADGAAAAVLCSEDFVVRHKLEA